MATIQEATQAAMAFAKQLLGSERTQGLRLEEIESGSDAGVDVWRITLSALSGDLPMNNLEAFLGGNARRDYKTFTVRKDTGEVTAMRIREIAKA